MPTPYTATYVPAALNRQFEKTAVPFDIVQFDDDGDDTHDNGIDDPGTIEPLLNNNFAESDSDKNGDVIGTPYSNKPIENENAVFTATINGDIIAPDTNCSANGDALAL